MKQIVASKWKWYGHAAHFIAADNCLFHMTTVIGDYIISTIGDYYPKNERSSNPTQIGLDRLYETYVFIDTKRRCSEKCKCPLADGGEIDALHANDRVTANANHTKLCRKYAKKVRP